MGITERREREKEQRRNDIIDAAERVFFSKGKNAATMDDVAVEAELSKGTLYLYFKSKEELYLAINIRGMQILSNMFEQAVSQHQTGIEKTRAIGEAYFRFSREYPDYFNALMYFESHEINLDNCDSIGSLVQEQGHGALSYVIDAIQCGINDGTIRKDIDPKQTAIILWAQTTGLIQILMLKGDHFEQYHKIKKDELIEYSFEFLKYALQPTA